MSGIDLNAIRANIEADLEKVTSAAGLEEVRLKYLGRKGVLAQLTATIPTLPLEERRSVGQAANSLKETIAALLEQKKQALGASADEAGCQGSVDLGMPGIAQGLGRLHPLTQTSEAICRIFADLGFGIVEGPEVETEFNNFTGLNISLEHPSRDAFDTFYLASGKDAGERLLLRSHTSPMQVRVMLSRKPPLAVVVPGRVYRPDAVDASHSFMFHQVEGLMVGQGVRFSDLKGLLTLFANRFFGEGIRMRFRPHYFPFTEPSAEVDISCIICKGSGCSVCGRKGWLEILGAGMVHPNVFKAVGYDHKKFTGFAFGMGVERIAMLKHGIDDIRLFFENDVRFLRQF